MIKNLKKIDYIEDETIDALLGKIKLVTKGMDLPSIDKLINKAI